ncbi:hypothetical protein [Glycomyces xiaoerkulensis]|uniref:hypothetical protein n=1 Tax=Glycomyces xiaoerkulensis TaxID=2038139 RepID=UPI0012FFFE5C|nr:hypothetical protein [Glycomyces xiaoerkulensis]
MLGGLIYGGTLCLLLGAGCLIAVLVVLVLAIVYRRTPGRPTDGDEDGGDGRI